MKIRPLKEEFDKKGVKYTQKIKNKDFVLYECKAPESEFTYYEVFKYKLAKKHPKDDGDYEKIEVYPSDNQFGVSAWCCSSIESLKRVFKSHFEIDFSGILNK